MVSLGPSSILAVMLFFFRPLTSCQALTVNKNQILNKLSPKVQSSIKTIPASTCLNALESRQLRFYNSSPILEERKTLPLSTEINPLKPVTGIFDRGTDEFNNSRDSTSQNRSFIRDESLPIETGPSSFSNPAEKKFVSEGSIINLTEEEEELFNILLEVMHESEITSTLRVAGGWVRDKLLATEEFRRGNARGSNDPSDRAVDRLTSKFKGPSSGRQGTKVIGADSSRTLIDPHDVPVDIDIALDDMLGREFADHLNEWMTQHGRKKISVGVVLKNPEKSKHLETATMKVGKF